MQQQKAPVLTANIIKDGQEEEYEDDDFDEDEEEENFKVVSALTSFRKRPSSSPSS